MAALPDTDDLGMTPKQYEAFTVYRDLGPNRSLEQTAKKLRADHPGRYKGTEATLLRRLKEWSRISGWPKHAEAHDAAQMETKRREREDDLDKMNDEQARLGRGLLGISSKRLFDLLKEDDARMILYQTRIADYEQQRANARGDKAKLATLKRPAMPKPLVPATSLIQIVRFGVEVERLARGEATAILETQGPGATMAPPEIHVHMTGTPPPEPVDPADIAAGGGLSPDEIAEARATATGSPGSSPGSSPDLRPATGRASRRPATGPTGSPTPPAPLVGLAMRRPAPLRGHEDDGDDLGEGWGEGPDYDGPSEPNWDEWEEGGDEG